MSKPAEVCSITGCDKRRLARGWCQMHYSRWRKTGDPTKTLIAPHGEARLFFRTVVLPFLGPSCLTWPYARNARGYAVMRSPSGKSSLVSRLACEELNGPPSSPDQETRHLCGKGHEGCCSPTHLVWGTPFENQQDKLLHGTDNRGERHPLKKLSREEVVQIRKLKGSLLQKEIAAKFNVARTTVSAIHNGYRWGWLS